MTLAAPTDPAPTPTARDRFGSYAQAVETLLQHFPGLYQLLHPGQQAAQVDGWQAMLQRFGAFQAQGRQPVLVATLYGPTGAGKSTLFRMLTGVDVPAGDVERPMSYACAVAVPGAWSQSDHLQSVFPRFELEPLVDPQQLRKPDDRTDRLFHVAYPAQCEDKELPLILADVPDFDSVAQQNWAKAEYMLQRAEVVVFLVYAEGYANETVVRELARGCRIAARLAYLFTKTPSADHARKKWEHLLETLEKKQTLHGTSFQERRSDGRTLLEFLRQSPVYYSPRRDAPQAPCLEDVQGVYPETPPLNSLLRGLDAENLLLAGLLEPTGQVVQTCRRELGTVQQRIEELMARLAQAQKAAVDVAGRIASSEFPISRMMQLVLAEARKEQGWLIKGVTFPFKWIRGMVGGVVQSGKDLVNMMRGAAQNDEILTRHDLEQRRLGEGIEHLINLWRGDFRSLDPHLVEQNRVAPLREAFKQIPVPTPANHWENHVRHEVHAWAKEHPWLCDLLPSLGDVLAVVGGSVLVVDLVTTGGLFGSHVVLGSLGVAGAAAAGGAAAGVFMQWVQKWQLGRVVEEADRRWREQRTRELTEHLTLHFFKPMFHPWFHVRDMLEKAPVAECAKACDNLEQLLKTIKI